MFQTGYKVDISYKYHSVQSTFITSNYIVQAMRRGQGQGQ